MKVYISLPMAGHLKTVRDRYDSARLQVLSKYGSDVQVFGPTNIHYFSDKGLNPNVPVHPWSWHLGEDIKDLLECDVIYLCRGWSWSKGCRTEVAVAKANLIEVVKQEDADKSLDS